TVLEVDLGRGLLTEPPADPLSAIRSRTLPQLSEVVTGLRRAAEDRRVAAAVLHIGGSTLGASQAEELGAAHDYFAEARKPVIAWAETFGELGPGTVAYFLAAHASTIWIQPSGTLGLTGVALDVMTFRGALDKVGAQPQFGQRHEYKSAAETFMSTEISAPNREMTQRIADSVMERVAD